ncbi:putative metallo-beta-lactamase domain protein [Aspergillus ellipticus CBS 707.79]|uniref:Putative metallo-beta-lactamase domain protein n=1 Tax=Aspergillus ellipticus CBS 707.79 TaxID=1448320 RepID=A0A319D332_9EURO|nr:putative metallo-beta-lactamase domain protein [Aspergillus ellipticus CBS 707.79]
MLQTHHYTSSTQGLSSLTTLLTTPTASLLIDPPFLLTDAHKLLTWLQSLLTPSNPLKAIFITHHHPDHFFSANPILDAFPGTRLYAAPYVLARIDHEYAQKVAYWTSVFGAENIPAAPRKPEPYPFSFFVLGGHLIMLLGPVVGDCVDQTVFWIPGNRTVVAGDVVYGRSVHVWVEELESPALLHAWQKTLDLIERLQPEHIIPGHMEAGWELDAKADLAHTRRYLDLFAEKIAHAPAKMPVAELYGVFEREFPLCCENRDFFLGHMANQFGEGGTVWEENRHPDVRGRTGEGLNGYLFE